MMEIIKQERIISESDTCIVVLNRLYHIVPTGLSKVNIDLDNYNYANFVTKCGVPKEKDLLNEYKKLLKLKHKNIIKVHGYDAISNVLKLEYIDGYDLIEFINTNLLHNNHIRYYFKQMLTAVQHVHIANIIHCDIKLENFMIDGKNKVKLIDFEFAIKNGLTRNLCGTIEYLAPEILSDYMAGTSSTNNYTPKSDIWSLGVTLYCMYYKKHPFCDLEILSNTSNNTKIANLVLTQDVLYEEDDDPDFVHLLTGMLDKNPDTRFTVENILTCSYLKQKN
jgi:serine/threonine protein kinase